MKKLILMLSLFAFCGVWESQAQSKDKKKATENPIKVEKFTDGKTLTEDDLGFLNAVLADKENKSRGGYSDNVTIGENEYSVGDVLSKEDVEAIEKAISDSKNSKKVENKDKSRGDCNLWCYYYLKDSYGNWYYYYYCCG
ncbi:MAG: hypothetical protein H6605_01205 [Flavobacteriales bacterium]|nr:hypothetical protein [Flavobacteriales bacterium]